MKTDFYSETLGIQSSMTAAAATEFAESDLDHLRTLIRLTAAFCHFLNDTDQAMYGGTGRGLQGKGDAIDLIDRRPNPMSPDCCGFSEFNCEV